MKKLRYNVLLLFILTLIVLFFVLKDDYNRIVDALLNSNLWYAVLAVIVIIIGDVIKSISVHLIIKAEKPSYTLKNAISLTMKTNFFNGITPFSLGGQPFQLYILKKNDDIDYTTGVNILFKDFYSYQIALVLLGTIFLIINNIFKLSTFTPIVKEFMIIAFIINWIIAIFLIYLPYSKGNAHKLVVGIINFLNKIKIIKDKEKTINKIDVSINKFKRQINEIIVNPKLITKCILLSIVKILSFGVSAGICFFAVGVFNIEFTSAIIITTLILTMASFIPIPGASGGMEFGFIALFGLFIVGPKLTAAMLLWRFTNYYLPMIWGAILVVFEKRK